MLAGWKTLDTQNNSWLSTYWKKKAWMTIKETCRWIALWGWNKSFIGLTWWPEEEKEGTLTRLWRLFAYLW